MNIFTDEKTKRMALTGVMCALVTISTMIIKIPIAATGGYVHPGDGLVILSGILLGPIYGVFAAGVGSALADVLAGYVIYAPATLVIKALSAFLAYLIYDLIKNRLNEHIIIVLSGVTAEILMVVGYFLFESVLLNPAAAAAGVAANIVQGVFGVVIATVLHPYLRRGL